MAEKKKILYIVEAMGGGVFTYIVECMMRRTFLTSALDMPEIMLYIYSKSWKLQFSASSSIIIIEDYYLQTFLHSLSVFPSCWSPSVYSR